MRFYNLYLQKKKARKDKKAADPSRPTLPTINNRNIKELLSKLQVDEKTKEHQFWDTQPVPKLGKPVS